jgi:hypothetical protein
MLQSCCCQPRATGAHEVGDARWHHHVLKGTK